MAKRQKNNEDLGLTFEANSEQRTSALYALLGELWGVDKLVLKASKLETLQEMRSEDLSLRILALMRLIEGDPTIETVPLEEEYADILDELEEAIANELAHKGL